MSLVRALACVALAAIGLWPAGQQTRDAAKALAIGTAQIAGTVVTSDQPPVPLRRATVVLAGDRLSDRLVVVTDDTGAFAFTSLPADRYSLSASKSAYVPMSYGSKRPGGSGTPIVVMDGQRVTVSIGLARGGVIVGTVRDGLGRPVPDVTVSALRYIVSYDTGERTLDSVAIGSAGAVSNNYAPDAFPGTAMTDDRGEYRIYGLAAGDYVVSASVRPWPGRILDDTGVHQTTASDVQRALQLLRGSGLGLPADAATGSQARGDSSRVDYVPVYHPAAIAREDAATVTLGPSEERAGIDVLLRMVPTAKVSGYITAPDGSPQYNAQVSIMDPTSSAGRVFRAARSTADGEFWIEGIPPGRYALTGSAYPNGFTGKTDVVVEGRDVTASLVVSPGISVSGRIVFDGKTPPPAFTAARPFLRKQGFVPSSQTLEVSDDGRFVFSRVPPGRFTFSTNGRPPAGWILRSVMVNGVDVSDLPFDVTPGRNIDDVVFTLTDRPAEISGVLQTAAGVPAPDYVLIVFSADPLYWVPRTRRTQQVRPDIGGRFVARDLPAGDYLIAAVTDLENGQWNDPAFLAELAASGPIKISVVEGDKKVQDIRIGGR